MESKQLWSVHVPFSHPDTEIALHNVCAKFYFVYICPCSQSYITILLNVLFPCCLTLSVTIIVITLERGSVELQSRSLQEPCMSSAEAPYLPRNVKLCVCLLILVQNHWCEDIWNDPNNFKGYFKGTVTPKMYMFLLWWGWRLEASMHSLEHNDHKHKQCIWNQRNSRTFGPGTLVWAGLCRS